MASNINKTALVHTHIDVPNYGANLQALATKLVLESFGLNVTYAVFHPIDLSKKYSKTVPDDQLKLHKDFVAENFQLTQTFEHPNDYHEYMKNSNFNYHITGSDAVFRLSKTVNPGRWDLSYPNPFWLNNLDNMVSLSASAMGTKIHRLIANDARKAFVKHMESFRLLSVRDEWTQKTLELIGVHSRKTLDPVFCLSKFLRKADANPIEDHSKYVVASFPRSFEVKKINQLKTLFDKSGINLVEIGTPENPKNRHLSPIDWYYLIANSEGYIGTRFHPLVVAIANLRPVYCIDMYARHILERRFSKSYLLLEEFGLTAGYCDRLSSKIVSAKEIHKHMMRRFDYKNVLEAKVHATVEIFKTGFIEEIK